MNRAGLFLVATLLVASGTLYVNSAEVYRLSGEWFGYTDYARPRAPVMLHPSITPGTARSNIRLGSITPTVFTSFSDEIAQRDGYRDWNDYVAHRPANKLGVDEPEIEVPTPPTTFGTSEVVEAPEPIESYPTLAVTEIVEPASALEPSRYVHNYIALGGATREIDRRRYSAPVSVTEPGTLSLLLIGAAGLLASRRLRA